MKGLRLAIRNNIPRTWEIVLLKYKILTTFIEYCYQSLPDYMKGHGKCPYNQKYQKWKIGLNRIQHLFTNAPIYNCFCGKYLEIYGIVYWQQIWNEIKELENTLK